MVLGEVGPQRRVGSELLEGLGLKRTYLAHRDGFGGPTILLRNELRKRVANVSRRIRLPTDTPQRMGQKLREGRFSICARHCQHTSAPKIGGEIQLAAAVATLFTS